MESYEPFGSGHINDTYRLTCRLADGNIRHYILQRMNKEIFTKPVELMENVVNVTSYLRKIIIEKGGDPERETLNIIKTKDGQNFYKDSNGEYWRVYVFIEDAFSYDAVEKPEDFYESAVASEISRIFWADYPADTLLRQNSGLS